MAVIQQPELFEIHQAGNLTVIEPAKMTVGRIVFNPAPADPLPTFAPGSETSRQAAIDKYDRHNSKNQRDTIYRLVKFRGEQGATREEIQEALEMSGDTVRPRIQELRGMAKGWTKPVIKLSGKTRKTKSGMNAEVLISL